MLERCLKGIIVQSSQLGGVLQPILKKTIKHSAGGRFSADRYFFV